MRRDKTQNTKLRDIVEYFKQEGMGKMLEKYGGCLPHEELFCKLSKSERDKEHIEKVVRCMNYLLDRKFGQIVDTRPGFKRRVSRKMIGPLKEIIRQLDDKEKDLLLGTALYHDIGKAIIRPRHGPEGADIIKDSGRSDRIEFYKLGLERSDFLLMSDLIRFHDYLAMIQTGETTYLTFVEVLCPITNIALEHNVQKFLDYLLLINLADLAGAIEEKVDGEKFSILMEDFRIIKTAHDNISRKVYTEIFKQQPPADMTRVHQSTIAVRQPGDIIPELQEASENTAAERLRRLLRTGFQRLGEADNLNNYKKNWIEAEYKKETYLKEFDEWFTRLDEKGINDIVPVIASLRGLKAERDFYTKFAFICKLDYALGFVGKLIQEMTKIEIEKFKMLNKIASASEQLKKEDLQKALGLKSPHDLRRDIAMSVTGLIATLVDLFGHFTSDNTRIGLGFERFTSMANKDKLLRRLSGEEGSFKRAEALAKFRYSIDVWIIAP